MKLNRAMVLMKPLANTPLVEAVVRERFAEEHIDVVSDGTITGAALDATTLAGSPKGEYSVNAVADPAQLDLSDAALASFCDTFHVAWHNALRDGEVYVEDLVGTVRFQAQFWPDQYPCPVPWFAWTECQTSDSPTLSRVGFRPRMGLGEPSGRYCDVSNNRPLRDMYTMQFDLQVTGHCVFIGARFKAVTQPQPEYAPQLCEAICP